MVHLRNRGNLPTKPPPVALEPAFFIRFIVEIEAPHFGPTVIFERGHELPTAVRGRWQILAVNEIGPDNEPGFPKFLTPYKPACPVGAGGGFFDKQNAAEARRKLQKETATFRPGAGRQSTSCRDA
jgi:hypothetical protein